MAIALRGRGRGSAQMSRGQRKRSCRRLLLGNAGPHRRIPGVVSTRVGYTGGDVANATYRNHGTHAEAIEIIFDPEELS